MGNVDRCASCNEPVTSGDHDVKLPDSQSKHCPICGSDLVRRCERLDGSGVVKCSGGHVLEASALEMF